MELEVNIKHLEEKIRHATVMSIVYDQSINSNSSYLTKI